MHPRSCTVFEVKGIHITFDVVKVMSLMWLKKCLSPLM